MEIVGYIALGVLGLFLLSAALVVLVRRWGEKVLRQMREEASARGESVLRGDGFASFRGRISDGYPLRGNAALLLTDRTFGIHVFWPRPPRVLEIPHERLRRIEVTRAFMGMFEPNGFVVLHVAVGDGEDAVAFTVRRLPDWVGDIVKTARPHLRAIQGRETGGTEPPPTGEPAGAPGTGSAERGADGDGPSKPEGGLGSQAGSP